MTTWQAGIAAFAGGITQQLQPKMIGDASTLSLASDQKKYAIDMHIDCSYILIYSNTPVLLSSARSEAAWHCQIAGLSKTSPTTRLMNWIHCCPATFKDTRMQQQAVPGAIPVAQRNLHGGFHPVTTMSLELSTDLAVNWKKWSCTMEVVLKHWCSWYFDYMTDLPCLVN